VRSAEAARGNRRRHAALRGGQGRLPDERAAHRARRTDGERPDDGISAIRRRPRGGHQPRPGIERRAAAGRGSRQARRASRRPSLGLAPLLRPALRDASGVVAGVHAVPRRRALPLRPGEERAEDQALAVLGAKAAIARRAADRARAVPLLIVAALGAGAFLFDVTLRLRLPRDADYAEAAAALRVRAGPSD